MVRSPEREERPVDYSKAPVPKKADAVPQTPIMVFGDSMADWLAYGLEQAFADSPEIGILRRHRTSSGLIRTEVRNDPRGEYPDWPQAAKEMIAAQKPKFVVMMIGLNDRKQIKEAAQSVRAKPAASPNPEASDPAAQELDTPEPRPAPEAASAAAEAPGSRGAKTFEFRTDDWSEAYIRRIDDTIAALKTSGVPIFWVGLPPLRAGRAAADIPFLNDLYRSRSDKAGIVYVDVWDGFVDEDGRFAQSGPDFEGQTRRLRAGDGVHFTQAGARKLAHFVEREIDRWLSARAATVALPVEDTKAATSAAPELAAGAATGKAGVEGEAALWPGRPIDLRGFQRIGRAARRKCPFQNHRCSGNEGAGQWRSDARARRACGRLRVAAPWRGAGRQRSRRRHHGLADDAHGGGPGVGTGVGDRRRGHRRCRCSPGGAAAARRVRAAEYRQYRPDYLRRQQFNFFPFLFGGGR